MNTQPEVLTSELAEIQVAEFFIEPFRGEQAENILSSISIDKVYLTRINEADVEKKIIKESTPLFSYVVDNENSDEEHKVPENDPQKTFIEIDPDYRDENSNIDQSGKHYVATKTGLFILDGNKPKIIPISLHGSSDIRISDDSMFVYVDIYPSIGDNPITSLEDIVSKIEKLGVKTPIDTDLITKKLNEVKENKEKFIDVCVSKGKPAINGIDGVLENCTNKKENLKNFDFDEFHKVNPVISVKEEQIIAKVHPPTEGENGNDVFCNTLAAKPGKEFSIKLGTNTAFSEENENEIIAKNDGFINFLESSISITDTFTVNGDIDFKSGNIVSKGSLKVRGNVKNEFTLSLTKNVEVGGYVGDALIEAGQKIKIHGGFLGKGKGILRAEEDIELKFVENQKVFTRDSLTIFKGSLNAKLYAKNSIIGKGNSSAIIGGYAIAGDNIEVYSLGNDIESETIVEVGFDYLKRNSIIDNKEKQFELRKTLELVDKNLLEYARMKRLNPKCVEKVKILANEHKRLLAEIESLKEANMKITNEIYVPTSSKISINGPIYPGVRIGINGRFLNVLEPMRAKTFTLSNDNEVIAI